MESGNAYGYYQLAGYYKRGVMGMPQDMAKANELRLRAAERACSEAYCNLGFAYDNGMGVEVDKKKAKHFYELGAMSGDVTARYNLACLEGHAGNHNRAFKHYILSARAGDNKSLNVVKGGFMRGFVTKDEYANTLRAYQQRHDEMKSVTGTKLLIVLI